MTTRRELLKKTLACVASWNLYSSGQFAESFGMQDGQIGSEGRIYSRDDLIIGQGFNTVRSEQASLAVKYDQMANELVTATGARPSPSTQEVSFSLTFIESISHLRSELGISASASVGLGFVGADFNMKILNQSNINRYESFMLVSADVSNPSEVLRRSILTPEAAEYIAKKPELFLRKFGDRYIYGRRSGARFSALVRFSSSSDEERRSIQASLQGGFAFFRASGDFSSKIQTLNAFRTKGINVLYGGSSNTSIESLDKLAEVAAKFPQQVPTGGGGLIRYMLVRGYETVEGFPIGVLNYSKFERQQDTLSTLANYHDYGLLNQGNLQYILDHPNQFGDDGSLFDRASNALLKNNLLLDKLKQQIGQAREDEEFVAPPKPAFISVNAPRTTVVVQLFEHANFGGRKVEISSSVDTLKRLDFNDMASSLKVFGDPGQYSVTFFLDDNFQAESLTLQSPCSIEDLSTFRTALFLTKHPTFNDQISSIKIIKNK